ncbi:MULTISPECIES: DUF5684 domain-containing protein [Microbacterium]|uniref:DUF5684 domain-containing protein n=1 Tax=Microbacterium TaxID=33882 RepID=UPI00146AA55D|nr:MULTISPECIES: DUF5684 domain-containing protein [Microbacterium]
MSAVDASPSHALAGVSLTAADAAPPVFAVLVSLVLVISLYVWTAIALSAVFRKSGEEGWKAWVPVYNTAVLLQLGGFSGWLVLVGLVPGLGALVLWALLVISCYRINVVFGYGVGMTVLAALLLPVWATVLGFGSARWLGAEHAAGVRRSDSTAGEGPVVARQSAAAPISGPAAFPASAPPLPPAPAAPAAPRGWAPEPVAPARPAAPPLPPGPARVDAALDARDPDGPISFVPKSSPGQPPAVPAARAEADRPISFVPAPAASANPGSPAAGEGAPADPDPLPASARRPDVPPVPPAPPAAAASARANQGWGGFDLGAVSELTSEVTAAVSGAPQPVSAVSAERGDREDGVLQPPVTRVPAARVTESSEPWAPARSPLPEADAFPEASGEVSAVAGAPDAGTPRSALSSVSAQHVRPEIPEGVDETVIARRRKSSWALILPTGSAVDLAADVVLVGRRPAPSSAFPDAQLVEVDDGTVSKTHLRLERNGEEWSVTDLHSTNGTVLIASDGSEREIIPGTPHRAPRRFLLGDAELRLSPDDASR